MAKKEFTVRALSESDLAEWLRLRLMLWDESSENDHRAEMVDIYQHSDTQFVAVAEIKGDLLAGFLEASIRSHVEDCVTDNVGYLEGWFVEENYRRLGIGGGLVALAEDWARQKGCTEMASDAEINNVVSQLAHEKLGYSETSRLIHLKKKLV